MADLVDLYGENIKQKGKKPGACCKKDCLLSFTSDEKNKLLEMMERLGGYEERSKFLASCMTSSEVANRREHTLNRRSRDKTTKYTVQGTDVCREAFIKLLGITQKRVTVLRRKMEEECYKNMTGRYIKKRKMWTDDNGWVYPSSVNGHQMEEPAEPKPEAENDHSQKNVESAMDCSSTGKDSSDVDISFVKSEDNNYQPKKKKTKKKKSDVEAPAEIEICDDCDNRRKKKKKKHQNDDEVQPSSYLEAIQRANKIELDCIDEVPVKKAKKKKKHRNGDEVESSSYLEAVQRAIKIEPDCTDEVPPVKKAKKKKKKHRNHEETA